MKIYQGGKVKGSRTAAPSRAQCIKCTMKKNVGIVTRAVPSHRHHHHNHNHKHNHTSHSSHSSSSRSGFIPISIHQSNLSQSDPIFSTTRKKNKNRNNTHRTCAHSSSVLDVPGIGGGDGGAGAATLSPPEKVVDKVVKKKRPPNYNVMLHNDDFNVREYVVQVLLKVIPGMTIDIAVSVMQEAHQNGLAQVITCAQDEAEEYCEGLRGNGLTSTIEPATS